MDEDFLPTPEPCLATAEFDAAAADAGQGNNSNGLQQELGRQARLPSSALDPHHLQQEDAHNDHDDILESVVAAAAEAAAAAEEDPVVLDHQHHGEEEEEAAARPSGNAGSHDTSPAANPLMSSSPPPSWLDPHNNKKRKAEEGALALPEAGQHYDDDDEEEDDDYHPNGLDHHDDPGGGTSGDMAEEDDDFDESYHDDEGHDHQHVDHEQSSSGDRSGSHHHHADHREDLNAAPNETEGKGGDAPPATDRAPKPQVTRSAPARVSWEDRIEQLKAYKAEHGDLLIPIRYKLNPSLGKFVHNTREQFKLFHKRTKANYKKKCSLTHERLAQLDQIGFAWTTERAKKHQEDWNSRFEQLLAYKAKHGDCLVPHGYQEDRSFAEWVHRQRTTYANHVKEGRTNQVTEVRMKKLEEIGFNFRVHVDRWTVHYEQLQEYRKQHGHCMVPTQFPENAKLGRWVHTQRFQHRLMLKGRKSSMTEERVKLLEGLGFSWEVRPTHDRPRASWQQRFSELKAYRTASGHLNVSPVVHPRLYSWCSEQLQRLKAYDEQLQASASPDSAAASSEPKVRGMSPDRVIALASIGFTKDLELTPVECEAGAAAVAAARELEGHSSNDEDDDHHHHTDLEEHDDEEGRDRPGESWYEHFSQLQAFRTVMGHLRVSPVHNHELYSWCSEQLHRLKAYYEQLQSLASSDEATVSQPNVEGMSPDRVMALDSIGFTKDLVLAPVESDARVATMIGQVAHGELEGQSSHAKEDDSHHRCDLEEDAVQSHHEEYPVIEDCIAKTCDGASKADGGRKHDPVEV